MLVQQGDEHMVTATERMTYRPEALESWLRELTGDERERLTHWHSMAGFLEDASTRAFQDHKGGLARLLTTMAKPIREAAKAHDEEYQRKRAFDEAHEAVASFVESEGRLEVHAECKVCDFAVEELAVVGEGWKPYALRPAFIHSTEDGNLTHALVLMLTTPKRPIDEDAAKD